jgi:protocatechuate 3,4-dioxygenase beta subunit
VQWIAHRDEEQTLVDETRGADPTVLGEVKTDAEGRFRVTLDKPEVSAALRILAAGFPSVHIGGPFDSTEDVALDDIPMPVSARVSGRIIDEAGNPVSGARVVVSGSELFVSSEMLIASETHTGADGSFSMIDAPAGGRSLVVRAPGYVRASRIQINPRAEERIVLARGGTVQGTVLDAASSPVSGAIVTAGEVAAMSDAAGHYQITGVAPGARHVQTLWKDDLAARADNVRVKKGEPVDVTLRLSRAASITGTVVEERTKKPVGGAQISVLTAGGGGPFSARTPERTVHTDSRGRFRVGGLASRDYVVSASRDGYLPTSMPNIETTVAKAGTINLALRRAASVSGKIVDEKGTGVAGARVSISANWNLRTLRTRGLAGAAAAFMGRGAPSGPDGTFRLKNVTPGQNLEIEVIQTGYATARHAGVTLKPGDAVSGLSIVLKKGLAARGTILDAQGQPVAGAEMRVALREGGLRGARVQLRAVGMDREKPDAVSAANGNFTLGGLSVGQYQLTVSKEGFAQKSVPSLEVKADVENVWSPITLSPGIALGGTVQNSAGQAIPGALILVVEPGGVTRPTSTSTGPDGKFRLDGLTADHPLMLNVSADGYGPAQRDVTPPASDVYITLKSSAIIRGRVEDTDAKTPIVDFTVGTRGGGGGGPGRFLAVIGGGGPVGDKAFHAEDGSFELDNVPAGKWTVHATASGYRPADIAGVDVGEGATRDGVVLSLKRGGSLVGRVLDPQLGTGVANANVSYQGSSSSAGGGGGAFARLGIGGDSNTTATTDADGHFAFDGTPDGKVMVTASHPDYLDVTQEVDLSKQTSVDLMLGTGGSISGTVVAADGRTPIPGAQVSLNPEGDTQFGFANNSARSDGSGNFIFDHLQAGRFRVIAQSSDGRTTNQEVVLANSQRMTGVLLQMAVGTLLQGTVSGLPAGRLGGVRVTASAPNYNDSATTDDSGKYTLQNVPSGAVRLNATTSNVSGRSTAVNVDIPDGATQFTADIVFQGASRLSGRVSRGATALSGVMVNAIPVAPAANTGAGRVSGQTDDNGQYDLEGLSDGDYTVALFGQSVSYRKTFTVSGDTPGDIQLPTIQVTGMVTEAGSGEPLDSATVQLQAQASGAPTAGFGGMKSGSGDSTGHYFIDDVDPGTYQVIARRDGYQAQTQTLTVGSDSPTLNFGLQRGEGISIRVGDGLTGLPLTGVIASAVDASGAVAFQGSITLDSTGKGEISSLAPGRYAVHVTSDGYASRTNVLDAPSSLVPIVLTPGGRVEVTTSVALQGRVVDGAGLPYQLNNFRADGRVSGSPPVITWIHVAPGSYQLLVGVPGSEVPYPFTVVEGQTTTVVVK